MGTSFTEPTFAVICKKYREIYDFSNLPPVCTAKERWHDRKCLGYCAVAANCPYGRMLKEKIQGKAA